MDFHPDIVIIAGGDYPTNPIPVKVLKEAGRIICCDGAAADYVWSEGKAPWRIVGDGDSLPKSIYTRFPGIEIRIPDQETNDQTKATKYAMEHGAKCIAYLGGTGRREDHTLGNISLLMEYLRMGVDARMYTDYGVFIPCRDHFEGECLPETQVSIFNFGAKGLRGEGLRYPLSDFTNWWQGTLNACLGNAFRIDGDGEFLVYMTYEQKITKREKTL